MLTFLIARAVIGLLMRRVLAKVLAGTSNSLLLLASLLVGLSMLDLPERCRPVRAVLPVSPLVH